MSWSYGELIGRVPKGKRRGKILVTIGLFLLERDLQRPPTTKEIDKLLDTHLRGRKPRNVSDILSKASADVEPIGGEKGRAWKLTDTGIREIRKVIGLELAQPEGKTYSLTDMHPRVRNAAADLFLNKHYPEAVGRATKALNLFVRQRTCLTKDDGVVMMHRIFSADPNSGRRILVTDIKEDWQRDLQEGVRFIMAGVQQAFANVDKHGELKVDDETTAIEMLSLLSFLANTIEKARVV